MKATNDKQWHRRTCVICLVFFLAMNSQVFGQTVSELEDQRQLCVDKINVARSMAGLSLITVDPILSGAAQEHASYLLVNKIDPRDDVHTQNPQLRGASLAGAKAAQASIIMEKVPPSDVIAFHLSTLFHRLPLLNPGLRRVGIGAVKGEPWVWASVIDVQSGVETSNWKQAIWVPGNQSQNIPTTFGLARPGLVVHESPNPLGDDQSAGYPITVTFPKKTIIAKVSFELRGPLGPVPCYLFWPDNPPAGIPGSYLFDSIGAIPKDPLSIDTKYIANLEAQINGQPYQQTIEFTTGDNSKIPSVAPTGSQDPAHAYWFQDSQTDLWGLMNVWGQTILDPQFDAVEYFEQARSVVNKGGEVDLDGSVAGGKWGVVSTNGAILVAPRYDDLLSYVDGRARFRNQGSWGFLDLTGNAIIPASFQETRDFSQGLAAVKKNQLWGFVDLSGKQNIPFSYQAADRFYEGLAAVKIDQKYGYIDSNNKLIIAAAFDLARPFSEGFAPVKLGQKWGLINKTGAVVVSARFDGIQAVKEAHMVVTIAGKQGLADTQGNLIIAAENRRVEDMSDGMVVVEKPNYHLVYYDRTGKQVGQRFIWAQPFVNGRAAVSQSRISGFVDKSGAWILETNKFLHIQEFQGDLARASVNDMDQIIDDSGKVLWYGDINSISHSSSGQEVLAYNGLKPGFLRQDGTWALSDLSSYSVSSFSNNLAVFTDKKRKVGFIGLDGTIKIAAQFDDAKNFGNGLAPVKIAKLWGYCDSSGQMRIPAHYDFASTHVGNFAIVRKDELSGVIDLNNNFVIALAKRSFEPRLTSTGPEGWFVVKENGRAGFMDAQGQWQIRPTFLDAKPFTQGRAAVRLGSDWGYIDDKGSLVVKPSYVFALPYCEGYAMVKKGSKVGYLDLNGKVAIPLEFEMGQNVVANRVWLAIENNVLGTRWGLADLQGNWIIPPRFDSVMATWKGGAAVRVRDGLSCYIDKNLRIIRQW